MLDKTKKKCVVQLVIFIAVTLLSGWFGVLVDSLLTEQPKGNSLGMGLWLILPFATNILLRLFYKDWKSTGLNPNIKGNVKWYLFSFSIYPIVTLITLSIAFLIGVADLSQFAFRSFLTIAIISTISSFLKNIFEEFAWRGYLVPKLLNLNIKDWLLYVISGLVWALWHSAYYMVFLPNEYFETTSRVGMIIVGCIIMPCWNIMFVELFRLTKSVWPCVIMHAIEDAVPTVLVTTGAFITLSSTGDFWLNPTTGLISIILFLIIGLFLRSLRIRKEKCNTI